MADDIPQSLTFAPDGRFLVVAGKKSVERWDLERRQKAHTFNHGHAARVTGVDMFGPRRLLVTAGDDGVIKTFDFESGALVRELRGHTAWVNLAKFSVDGRLILSGSDDGTLKLWETESGKPILDIKLSNQVAGIAFSPDGRLFAANDGRAAVVYPLAIDTAIREPQALIDEAQRKARLVLDGYELKSPPN
jgi:WD40 repeat protein